VKRYLLIAALLAASVSCDRGARPAQIGKPAPDFVAQDSQRRVALHDLRGKTVILNFWTSWCPPCIAEMPSLIVMSQKLPENVVLLGVSEDEDESAYRKFVDDRKLPFLTVNDHSHANRLYGTYAWPETYIIDADGIIRRKFIGPADWTNPELMGYLTRLASARTQANR
jgi:peroxiredoxin